MRALALFTWLALLSSGGCAGLTREPWVLDSKELTTPPSRLAEWISTYPQALATTLDVFERDLGLPPLQVRLVFLPNQAAFEQLLLEIGYPPALARDAAASMTAIGGFRNVLLNEQRLEARPWPERVGLLAHELTHALQYELGGGERGVSDQWLREGYADWIESHVLEALRIADGAEVRRAARREVRRQRADTLPALVDLATFPDWVAYGRGDGGALLYAQALTAVTFLIERHGQPAVLEYFSLFAASQDRAGNFQRAFHEPLEAFEAAFRREIWR